MDKRNASKLPLGEHHRAGILLGCAALTLALIGLGLIGLALIGPGLWRSGAATPAVRPRLITLAGVRPGHHAQIVLASQPFVFSVPKREGASTGTLECRPQQGRTENRAEALVLERKGSVESLLIADIDADGVEDGLLTIRSVGSGSYVQLVLLQVAADGGLSARPLPPATEVLPDGYGGHDSVDVRPTPDAPAPAQAHAPAHAPAQQVVRTFPIYERSDAQSHPTGGTGSIFFDAARWSWRRDT